ncbi:MAG: hypothetical protein OEY28_06635, partial [Nitrospira sp.]|nr:hypothetical protein [Nitrospira sp.]
NIRSTNQFILECLAGVLSRWEPTTTFRGISDLAIGERKISGNAQRRLRRAILFHGTILHGMQSDVIARYLTHPLRQPDYRRDRPHDSFLRTIEAPPADIKRAIAEAWPLGPPLDLWPEARMRRKLQDIVKRNAEDPGRA